MLIKRVVLVFLVLLLAGFVYFVLNKEFFFDDIGNVKKNYEIEVLSELDGVSVSVNQDLMRNFLEKNRVWEDGVLFRGDVVKNQAYNSKDIIEKIRISMTYNEFARDRVIVDKKIVSSAEEMRNGNELVIALGFLQDYYDTLSNEKKERYLTQSFIRTLYRITHINEDWNKTEKDLVGVLKSYKEADINLFNIE